MKVERFKLREALHNARVAIAIQLDADENRAGISFADMMELRSIATRRADALRTIENDDDLLTLIVTMLLK